MSVWLLLVPAAVVFVVVFVLPQGYLLTVSLRDSEEASRSGTFGQILGDGYYLSVLRDTAIVGGAATILTLLLGYPLAYWLARTNTRWKSLLLVLTVFPLLTSAVVRTFGWQVLFYKSGLLGRLATYLGIGGPSGLMGTMLGVILALAELLLPFMVLTLYGVIEKISPSLEHAAMDLGDGPLRAICRVILPLTKNAVFGGSLLVFSLAVSSFVTPSLIGGSRVQVMATVIYEKAILLLDYPLAAALSIILLAFVLALVAAYTTWASRSGPRRES
jgi:putative spermidine/putrescine transport system permease protein